MKLRNTHVHPARSLRRRCACNMLWCKITNDRAHVSNAVVATQEVLDGLAITNDHFKFALQHCNPSALRETLVEVSRRHSPASKSVGTPVNSRLAIG